jgi:integrase
MAIYKRCQHRGRERDRCADPWYGTYQLEGHRRVRVSLAKWSGQEIKTKGDAQAAFDDVKAAVRAGTFDPRGRGVVLSSDDPMTFAQLAKVYEERYVVAKNLKTAGEFKWRVKPLVQRFGEMPITKIRTGDVEDWQAQLRRPRLVNGTMRAPSAATVNRAVEDLRRMLNWAVSREYMPSSPFTRAGISVIKFEREDNRRNRRISSEEEDGLIAAAPPHLRALMILALDTGVRAGEMLAIRIQDVDLDRGEITLRASTTKSGKTRTVPFSTHRLRSVIEWFRTDSTGKVRPGKAPLITNEAGDAIGGFRTSWETAVLRAHGYSPAPSRPLRDAKTNSLTPEARAAFNALDLHWHDLRHEYACRLAERGVPLTKIQYLLGHASVVTTERYIHHTLAELSKAAAVLESGSVFDPTSEPRVGTAVARRYETQSGKRRRSADVH